MGKESFKYEQPFTLENGAVLPEIDIAYHTYGRLNADKSNVIWVCHALTANSDVLDWWAGLFGDNDLFNPKTILLSVPITLVLVMAPQAR